MCGICHILHWFNAAKLVFSLSGKLKCHHSNAHNASRKRSQPIDRETNGPLHDSHLTVTQTVSRGEEGCCLPSTPTPLTLPLFVHLHLPQERTHLNRSYQHRIPLCSTVGACICSMYMNVCAWERGMGVQLSPVGCDYFTTTNYSGKR